MTALGSRRRKGDGFDGTRVGSLLAALVNRGVEPARKRQNNARSAEINDQGEIFHKVIYDLALGTRQAISDHFLTYGSLRCGRVALNGNP